MRPLSIASANDRIDPQVLRHSTSPVLPSAATSAGRSPSWPSSSSRRGEREAKYRWAAGLAALAILLYAQVVRHDFVRFDDAGYVDPDAIAAAIRPDTKLVVMNHGSNVIGTVQPVAEVGAICREHDLLLLVDAAQTGGAYPIDVQSDQIDLLGFTGLLIAVPAAASIGVLFRFGMEQYKTGRLYRGLEAQLESESRAEYLAAEAFPPEPPADDGR